MKMYVHFIDLKIMNNCEMNIYIKDSNSGSSILNEAIKTIPSQFILFFPKRFWTYKKHQSIK